MKLPPISAIDCTGEVHMYSFQVIFVTTTTTTTTGVLIINHLQYYFYQETKSKLQVHNSYKIDSIDSHGLK